MLHTHTVCFCWTLLQALLGSPGGSGGKESVYNVGDLDSIPGLGRSPGEGNGYPLQYSGLENSMDCIVHGVAKSRTQLSDFHLHCKPSIGTEKQRDFESLLVLPFNEAKMKWVAKEWPDQPSCNSHSRRSSWTLWRGVLEFSKSCHTAHPSSTHRHVNFPLSCL